MDFEAAESGRANTNLFDATAVLVVATEVLSQSYDHIVEHAVNPAQTDRQIHRE